MAEKIVFANLDFNTQAIEDKNAALLLQISELKKGQKELRTETDNLSGATVEQAKVYANNDAALKSLNKEYNSNKNVLAEVTGGVEGLTSALDQENQTVEQAKKNNSALVKARNQVNAKTKEGKSAIEQINKKIDENNKFTKANSSELEKQRLNIGNYQSALNKLSPGLGDFISKTQESTKATAANVTGLKGFKLALASTGIGLIVVALGSLVAAWSSTQSGIDSINSSLAPLKGSFEAVKGIIQDIAVNIFGTLEDRWTVVSGSILSGINQVRIGFNTITGDSELVSELEEADKLLTTKIETAQDRINEKNKELGNIIAQSNERIKQGIASQKEIEALTISIEEKEIEITRRRGELNRQYEQSKEQLENINLTFEQREEAAKSAIEAQNELEKLGLEFADAKIARKKLENSLNDTSRADLLELSQLEAERENFAAEAAGKRTTVANQLRNFEKQRAQEATDLARQELEDYIAIQEERKERTIELNQEFDEEQALARAIKFEEELVALDEQGASRTAIRLVELDQQLQLALEHAEAEIENKTILEREKTLIEKDFAKQRQIINEQENYARLSAAKNTFSDLANLAGKESEVGKAAAIAATLINTYQGATAAYASLAGIPVVGPVLGAAAAGVAIASGLQNVGKIRSTQTPRAEQGALIELGGHRHHSGGTTVYDENGNPLVNAERGEILGVMNRNAAQMFMQYNNKNANGTYDNPFDYRYSANKQGDFSINEDSLAAKIATPIAGEIRRKKMGGVILSEDGVQAFETDGRNRRTFLNQRFFGR